MSQTRHRSPVVGSRPAGSSQFPALGCPMGRRFSRDRRRPTHMAGPPARRRPLGPNSSTASDAGRRTLSTGLIGLLGGGAGDPCQRARRSRLRGAPPRCRRQPAGARDPSVCVLPHWAQRESCTVAGDFRPPTISTRRTRPRWASAYCISTGATTRRRRRVRRRPPGSRLSMIGLSETSKGETERTRFLVGRNHPEGVKKA
jgi:hypothetical protein